MLFTKSQKLFTISNVSGFVPFKPCNICERLNKNRLLSEFLVLKPYKPNGFTSQILVSAINPDTQEIEEYSVNQNITLIAVSKKKPAAMINEAILANQTAFGENMIQEAINKMSAFNYIDNIEWHMIGHLQKNKVKFCPGNFHWIHSIDSTELAKKLEERCATKQKNINALIQVNLSQEKKQIRSSEIE